MIIDAHAHLLSEGVETQRIISSMGEEGIEKIINIGTDAKNSRAGVKLAQENENIFATVGIHPEYASETTPAQLDEIDALAGEKKVVAIGEIGLDYHYGDQDKEKQKQIFVRQLEIAAKHNLPVVIHTRDAKEDTLEILKTHQSLLVRPGIMHCFSEDGEYAKKFLDLGFYISYAGNVTYKKSKRDYIKDVVPLDRVLVETDSPYLSPEPLRGTKNEPARVWLTAQKLADIYEIELEKFAKITVENAKKAFNLEEKR